MKEARDYYKYFADGSADWHIKEPPARDLFFEEELKRLAGINTFGEPVLRVVWGGNTYSDVSSRRTLKYKQIWEGLTHFYYVDENGDRIEIRRESDAPTNKLVLPVYGQRELGRLRWFIERWQPIEDAVKSGRFDMTLTGADGKPLFRTPPRDGVYNCFFIVETANREYRALDAGVLDAVKQMWHYENTTSHAQKMADYERDSEREAANDAAARRREWQTANANEAIARAREESALNKETIIEAERQSNRLIFT